MQHPHRGLMFFSTCAVAIVFSGCSSTTMHTVTPVGPAPAVQGVGIQVNGVAPNRMQSVQFNEAMDPATINSQTITVTDASGTPASGKVAYDSSFDVASFQPNPALQGNTTYTLTVTTGVASQQGVHLASAYTNQFTTRADADKSPLTVVKVSPSANATCVSATTPIAITFNEGVDTSTLTSSNVQVTDANGHAIATQISYNVTNATVTLTPSTSLPSGLITVAVRNVADAAGVVMTGIYSWTFTTDCGGGGGGGGGTATTQYQAPLFSDKGLNTIQGQVTVDTAGNTTVQLTGAAANGSWPVQFCPASDPNASSNAMPCFDVTTISTDAGGNGTATAKFPKSGNWAGDFYLNDSGGNPAYQTFLAAGVNNETYQAILLPETTVDNGQVSQYKAQDPLTSGSVTLANGALKFTVVGAEPNATYTTVESETVYIDGSGSYALDNFNTDASGNGTATTSLSNGSGGDMFNVGRNAQSSGFMAGFKVP